MVKVANPPPIKVGLQKPVTSAKKQEPSGFESRKRCQEAIRSMVDRGGLHYAGR